MKNKLLVLLLMCAFAASADFVRLSDHVPSHAVNRATLSERVDPETQMQLTFVLPLRNQQELQQLIERLYDPADEQFGQYLSSEEFNERFAPTQEDYDAVVAHAQSVGLSIHQAHSNRTLLNVQGSAQTIESAFNLQLHHYMLPNGRQFHAPNDNPALPDAVALVLSGIVGLDNHAQWRPYRTVKGQVELANAESNTFPSGPGGGFAPADIVRAYNLSAVEATGANQNIALFELASYLTSDINAYTSHFGLPSAQLKNVLVDGGSNSGPDAEVTLDIQLALAIAPHSTIYVYEGPNSNQGVLDTYNRIATDHLAKQVSTSWGMDEMLSTKQFLQAENAIFQQMAAQGQTIYAAAGDTGAYDNYPSETLAVDDPASQPYVVGVSGRKFATWRQASPAA